MKVALLIIGNEILTGKVLDRNTHHAARRLYQRGHTLARVVTVSDDPEMIIEQVQHLRDHFEAVITSGGIGVTHDDVTIASVARAFGAKVIRSPEVEAYFRAQAGPTAPPRLLDLANIPEGAELIYAGTGAPESWPVVKMQHVYVLPGVPELFQMKLEYVIDTWPDGPKFYSNTVYSPYHEPIIAPWLDVIAKEFPDVSVGSYPQWGNSVHPVKVTFDGLDQGHVMSASKRLAEWIEANL